MTTLPSSSSGFIFFALASGTVIFWYQRSNSGGEVFILFLLPKLIGHGERNSTRLKPSF